MSKLQLGYENFFPLKLLSCTPSMTSLLHFMLITLQSRLLDLPAIDYSILTHRLPDWFCMSSTGLNLLFSFLPYRSQTVIRPTRKSKSCKAACWDSYSTLFFIYDTTLFYQIISKYTGICCYFYADDTQMSQIPLFS